MLKIDLKKLIFFLALLTPVNAFAVDFDGKFIQGHFIIGKVEPKSEIWIDKKKNKGDKRWLFCIWYWKRPEV